MQDFKLTVSNLIVHKPQVCLRDICLFIRAFSDTYNECNKPINNTASSIRRSIFEKLQETSAAFNVSSDYKVILFSLLTGHLTDLVVFVD